MIDAVALDDAAPQSAGVGDAEGSNSDANQRPSSASARGTKSDNNNNNNNTPKLRRRSGSDNMSSLRVVNASPPETPRRQLTLDDAPSPRSISSPTAEQRLMSSAASPGPPSVSDIAEASQEDEHTDVVGAAATTVRDGCADGELDQDHYNLKPPPPVRTLQSDDSLEALSERLFSRDHLHVILQDFALATRFARFLQAYRPAHADALAQYAASRKAVVAVQFANAVAGRMQPQAGHSSFVAATLDERFELHSMCTARVLIEESLPAYLTSRLVAIVTDTLLKEITGNSLPLLTELIPSLAEVYCISDPSLHDNPIVYASQEFYNLTQYTKDFTIGRNCRFLQGPKSSEAAVTRLIDALTKGEECCETILNYKRDGTPFWNLLMIAPLYDNKGSVRYFLGCQVDVSSLIAGGRGLESFAQLLAQDRAKARAKDSNALWAERRGPHAILAELGQLLTEEEANIVKDRVQSVNEMPSDQAFGPILPQRDLPSRSGSRLGRIVLGMDSSPGPERQLWPSATLGPSGRLPGVYQNYLLVRPYPSLRITFTSPSLRIPGLLQTKLLDRIGASPVREGLANALSQSQGVTAKVIWLTPSSNVAIDGGRVRWLHCTPLLGSDERVGVWMVVMCEDEAENSGGLRRMTSSASAQSGAQKLTSSKLYADYLKREGRESPRPMTAQTIGTTGSSRSRTEVHSRRNAEERLINDHFADF